MNASCLSGWLVPHVMLAAVLPCAANLPPFPSCLADFSGDGVVMASDVELLVGAWGAWTVLFVVSVDGLIVDGDLVVLVDDWGSSLDPSPCATNTQSCLKPGPAPGCGDAGCCNFVCSWDTYCCEVQWDQECVDFAINSGACEPLDSHSDPLPETVG